MISREVKYFKDYLEEADKGLKEFGRTPKYSTGDPIIDSYIGGGFGKTHAFEIVAIFGESGIGKSMFGLKMIAHEISKGTKAAAMFLEDQMGELINRIRHMQRSDLFNKMMQSENVELLPESATENLWKFDEIIDWIEYKYKTGIELFYIDHVQFLYENADLDSRDVWNEHRIFNKKLNNLCKKYGITLVIISHVNKDKTAKGVNKMQGSGSFGQATTKAIHIFEVDGKKFIEVAKSRYHEKKDQPLQITDSLLLKESYDPFTH